MSTMSDVYVGFPALFRPSYQDFVVHNGWGDDLNRADELVRYDDANKMMYVYDDTPNFSLPYDVGNYWNQADEMRTPGYAGYALLYADPATGGKAQPATTFYAQLLSNERYFTGLSASKDALYGILSGADKSLQATSDLRLAPFVLMACGPYALAPSGSVKMVLAYGVNGIPLDAAVQGIASFPTIPAGLDSLKASMTRARQLYNANYKAAILPPPAPDAEFVALPTSKSISITWPQLELTYTNPRNGRKNIREYRIYRSTRSFIGPYEFLEDIDAKSSFDRNFNFNALSGKWQYIDKKISLGVSYYYAVTSVDSDDVESWYTNRNETAVKATSEPESNASNVKVFPNPFREVSGFPTRGEENSIVWTSLPAECTIRIYTASGELVKTMKHLSKTSGQEVWDQLTDSRQQTAPGIYFWIVESPVGNARGTLLLIK
jgi:hypothetical protein